MGLWQLEEERRVIPTGADERISLLVNSNTFNGDTNVDIDESSYEHTPTLYSPGIFEHVTGNYRTAPSSIYTNGANGNAIRYAPHTSLAVLGNDFTIEMWVYSTTTGRYIFGQCNSSLTLNTISVYGYWLNTSTVRWGIYTGTTAKYLDITGLSINTWHHLAMVRDGDFLRSYRNGTQTSTRNVAGVTANNNTTDDFAIGALGEYVGVAKCFAGYYDGIRFINGLCLYPNGTGFTPPEPPLLTTW